MRYDTVAYLLELCTALQRTNEFRAAITTGPVGFQNKPNLTPRASTADWTDDNCTRTALTSLLSNEISELIYARISLSTVLLN